MPPNYYPSSDEAEHSILGSFPPSLFDHAIEQYNLDNLEYYYERLYSSLEELSDEQLAALVPLVGIVFQEGVVPERDTCLHVLAEATWRELANAYHKVIGVRL